MKKLINKFNSPIFLFVLAIILFLIAGVNTWFLGAYTFHQMYWWGQGALVLCGLTIISLIMKLGIIPAIRNYTKKK